jgi:hypothetical protein
MQLKHRPDSSLKMTPFVNLDGVELYDAMVIYK